MPLFLGTDVSIPYLKIGSVILLLKLLNYGLRFAGLRYYQMFVIRNYSVVCQSQKTVLTRGGGKNRITRFKK